MMSCVGELRCAHACVFPAHANSFIVYLAMFESIPEIPYAKWQCSVSYGRKHTNTARAIIMPDKKAHTLHIVLTTITMIAFVTPLIAILAFVYAAARQTKFVFRGRHPICLFLDPNRPQLWTRTDHSQLEPTSWNRFAGTDQLEPASWSRPVGTGQLDPTSWNRPLSNRPQVWFRPGHFVSARQAHTGFGTSVSESRV